MRGMRQAFVAVLIALPLNLACGGSPASPTSTPSTPSPVPTPGPSAAVSTVVGRVRERISPSGRAGVPGARIEIGGQTALTDASGDYQVTAVPNGTHTLRITKEQYQTLESSIVVSNSQVRFDTDNFHGQCSSWPGEMAFVMGQLTVGQLVSSKAVERTD